MIPNTTIDEIRNKADILNVIGGYVALKKRGKNYLGLCPFHSEKTPSFTVSPDKQIFHCFGCGEGGNVFAFLMKAENISFTEAVEMLGESVGVYVKPSTPSSSADKGDKERYFTVMEMAQRYFAESLDSPHGEIARSYIKDRAISAEAVKTFGLGYAQDSWDGLMNYLFTKGVSQNDMLKLGLVIERNDKSGYYDRFRGRLMFPIFDIRGRVIGFSGRILTAAKAEDAKYVNSPDSPIYNKGFSLFGIAKTKDDIKKAKTAVLVEGNVDLISCWQSGIKNVVAPLGTALTDTQAKTIRKFAEKVVIAFDADNAGVAAAARSVDILKDAGLGVYVAKIIGGKDPDEAIKAHGAEAFQAEINNAMPWMEFKVLSVLAKHNTKEIEGRAKAAKEAAALIGLENDELIRKGYIKLVAEKLGFNSEEVAQEVKRNAYYPSSPSTGSRGKIEKPTSKIESAEETLIKLALESEEMLAIFRDNLLPADFTGTETRNIAEKLLSPDLKFSDAHDLLMDGLPDEGSKKLLSGILLSELPSQNPDKVLMDCVRTIKAHHLKVKMEDLRKRMANAEHEGHLDDVATLHREFKDTNDAMRALQI
jgi:DNA primase